jgi:hypothetical protein
MLERSIELLERQLGDAGDERVSVAELTKAIAEVGKAVTTHRAVVAERPLDGDDEPRRRARKPRESER